MEFSSYSKFDLRDNFFAGFEAAALETPDKLCLVVNEEAVAFAELQSEAISLSSRLNAFRIENDLSQPVPIYGERSIQTAVAAFACYYSGIPFTVIEDIQSPTHAVESLNRIEITHPIWNLSADTSIKFESQVELTNKAIQPKSSKPDDLAIIILTSGSSGTPKGVMHSRRGIATRVDFVAQLNKIDRTETFLTFSPLSFGMGLGYFYLIALGATYINLDPNVYTLKRLFQRINDLGPTTANIPSRFAKLIGELNLDVKNISLTSLNIGGDIFRYEDIHKLSKIFSPDVEYVHRIGSSEGGAPLSFSSTIENLPANGLIEMEISKSTKLEMIPRLDIDKDVFELLVGNNHCLGYYNNRVLTEEKFFQEDGTQFWRSGDLVKKTKDNKYVYHSRTDDLIKLNGFLVSTTINETIRKFTSISESVVKGIRTDTGNTVVAFIQLAAEKSESDFFDDLDISLPTYRSALTVKFVDQIPLNNRKKVDYKKLEEML